MSQHEKPRSGGQILIDALEIHGVDTVFCVPGESYLAALDALYDAGNKIRLVTCRHESGVETGAPGLGRTEKGATISLPRPFWR